MAAPRPTNPPQPAGKLFILGLVAVIVVCLGVLAAVTTYALRGTTNRLVEATAEPLAVAAAPTGAVTVTGDPVAPMPDRTSRTDAGTEPSYGKVAPQLSGTGFDGKPVSIRPDGRYKAVYFVAHWCPHCQKELPLVSQLISEGKVPANMDIYVVSTSVRPSAGNFPPQVWLSSLKLKAKVMRDDAGSTAEQAYGGGGFPYVVYLDGQDRVIARTSGELGIEGIQAMWDKVSTTKLS